MCTARRSHVHCASHSCAQQRKANAELAGREVTAAPELSADAAALEAALKKLRDENQQLKLANGLPADDDATLFEAYLAILGKLLAARASGGGAAMKGLFDEYNVALVQLSDDFLREMYLNFMLLYTGEYTDEVLERCRIDEVSDSTIGFCEMQTIRIGELMDQPRHVRIQKLQQQTAKQEQQKKGDTRKNEAEAAKAARRERMMRADAHAYATLLPVVRQWASSGDKRYGRRQELQTLLMDNTELKTKLSALQWKQCACVRRHRTRTPMPCRTCARPCARVWADAQPCGWPLCGTDRGRARLPCFARTRRSNRVIRKRQRHAPTGRACWPEGPPSQRESRRLTAPAGLLACVPWLAG